MEEFVKVKTTSCLEILIFSHVCKLFASPISTTHLSKQYCRYSNFMSDFTVHHTPGVGFHPYTSSYTSHNRSWVSVPKKTRLITSKGKC